MQHAFLFEDVSRNKVEPFKKQLLKWIGNKQRFAHEIVALFPEKFGTYHEPFLGSGAVLGTLAPAHAVASDAFLPLVEIWKALKENPDELKRWYRERWEMHSSLGKQQAYEVVRNNYNASPNGADLLFLCRTCYGGVVRFRKADGYMSTPCGIHEPVSPESFAQRVDTWVSRIGHVEFKHMDYKGAFANAKAGDLIYCDPPYVHSQSILYKGQGFSFVELLEQVAEAKKRGVFVAVSIDGTKKSGEVTCELPIPDGLFEREIFVNLGRSMLRRFQMEGETLENELVSDRLLLTY
ncbi:MAG: DNA adenine methylase [Xanthomonadales bacterium]|nr:DNA adenine methylase [Xanthomonadales bacterium]